ncbi:EAL domain-containing protein [Pseudomonas aeruginosa]
MNFRRADRRGGGPEHSASTCPATRLNDPLFLLPTCRIHRTSPLRPERLYFELTGDGVDEPVVRWLRGSSPSLRDLGLQGGAGRFGSGSSSFNYLKNFVVDVIKIDGSFVRNLDKSPVDQAYRRPINQIAHRLGAVTVAEFVESREILDHLARLGVDFAQGYARSAAAAVRHGARPTAQRAAARSWVELRCFRLVPVRAGGEAGPLLERAMEGRGSRKAEPPAMSLDR